MKLGAAMKITNKLIEGVRISKERAERLRDKKMEITLAAKETVRESELINFLIDTYVERIKVNKAGELYIEEAKK